DTCAPVPSGLPLRASAPRALAPCPPRHCHPHSQFPLKSYGFPGAETARKRFLLWKMGFSDAAYCEPLHPSIQHGRSTPSHRPALTLARCSAPADFASLRVLGAPAASRPPTLASSLVALPASLGLLRPVSRTARALRAPPWNQGEPFGKWHNRRKQHYPKASLWHQREVARRSRD